MKRIFLFAGIVTACLHSEARYPFYENQDTARTDAGIGNATVYFGYGAELTHQARVRVSPATRFIIVNNLSTSVDLNSLQISCPEDLTLLSHQYSLFYPPTVATIKPKEIETKEDSIKAIQKDIRRIQNNIVIEQEILTKTGVLIETTVKTSTSNGRPITSDEVLKLVDYYNKRIERSKLSIFNYNLEIDEFNERIENIRKRIAAFGNTVATVKAKPYGQLILQVIAKNTGEFPLSLSYYTNNAGWTPVYDIRVNSKTNKVKLVYKASLTQTTGIDWKKTKLSLSTGTPNFGVTAPVLNAWHLQLYVPEIYADLKRRVDMTNAARNRMQSFGKSELNEVVVTNTDNGYAVEEGESTVDPATLQAFTTLTQGQLNTNFDIDLPYDIESNGRLHSVSIREQEIDCLLKNFAVPRLDRDAYLLAEVADWQNLDLLPGDANIIMDNTYIGKSTIDPNTTSDTLNLSLGKDKRLAVKRSLIKEQSSLKTSGSSSKQTFTYEILVKNNKTTEVSLLLKDQYPLSNIKEVVVELEERGGAIVNEEVGTLSWKVELKPGESRKFRFTYSVKFPKDKKIINLK